MHMIEDEATITEWLTYLKPLKISRRDFDRERTRLSQLAGRQAMVNDTIWGLLNAAVSRFAGDGRRLWICYSEMAELAASELKDPNPYLSLAGRYGGACLQRHPDPMNVMINKNNEAYELEHEGKIDEAVAIYEWLLDLQYPHPGPYERLRILYSKQQQYKDAIRVCKAFIKIHRRVRYPEEAERFAGWIPKLEEKQERLREQRIRHQSHKSLLGD